MRLPHRFAPRNDGGYCYYLCALSAYFAIFALLLLILIFITHCLFSFTKGTHEGHALRLFCYSPYGVQMFLTSVAWFKNSLPWDTLLSNQSLDLPLFTQVRFKLAAEAFSTIVDPS